MDENKYLKKNTDSITEIIIGSAFEVANTLGYGFLEKVYENALFLELKSRKIKVESQKAITVRYKGNVVGEYIADLLVENQVIVELKSVKQLTDVHKAQLFNYLTATSINTGLLINFGNSKVEVKRVLNDMQNQKKSVLSV